MNKATLSVLLALVMTGCMGRGSTNTSCVWPAGHDSRALTLTLASDARHLADDAQVAEDLAIRHADASRSPDWQRNVAEYHRVREECRARLNLIVAQQHGVPVGVVVAAVANRREWLDALVLAAFAILFLMAARWVVAFLLRGAIVDSRLLAAAMLFVAALAAGGVGAVGGGLWFGLIESLRVGNGHMSYRVDRFPIRRHPGIAFVAATAIFIGAAAHQYQKRRL